MPKVTERSKRYRMQREQRRKRRLERRLPKYLLESARSVYALHLASFAFLMLAYGVKGLCDFVYGPTTMEIANSLFTMVPIILAIPPLWAARDKVQLAAGSGLIWLLIALMPQNDALIVMLTTSCVIYLLWQSRDIYRSGI